LQKRNDQGLKILGVKPLQRFPGREDDAGIPMAAKILKRGNILPAAMPAEKSKKERQKFRICSIIRGTL